MTADQNLSIERVLIRIFTFFLILDFGNGDCEFSSSEIGHETNNDVEWECANNEHGVKTKGKIS